MTGVQTCALPIYMRDDFEANNILSMLQEVKKANPAFKISLFAIPKLGSDDFWNGFMEYDWIELCPHGLFHPTPRECQNWTYEQSLRYLDGIEHLGWAKIFKAPGWQISDGMYKALVEKGYAVADQIYNNSRRPKELQTYLLDNSNKLHFHIGNLGGINQNDISKSIYFLKNLKGNFKFISEYLLLPK